MSLPRLWNWKNQRPSEIVERGETKSAAPDAMPEKVLLWCNLRIKRIRKEGVILRRHLERVELTYSSILKMSSTFIFKHQETKL